LTYLTRENDAGKHRRHVTAQQYIIGISRAKQTALREEEVSRNQKENGSVMRLETRSIGLNLKAQ